MTNKETQHRIAPGLRFPEFLGAPLREVPLDEVTEECTTRNEDKTLPPELVMGVKKEDGIVPMEGRLVGPDISRYKLVRKNWFAYNPMRLNIGSIARWRDDRDVLVSPDYVVFRCLEDGDEGIDPAYLDHFRESDHWEGFVSESGIGSVRVRIYYKDLGRLRLRLPTLSEQRKIAACLDSLDDLIAAETRKLVALRAHKRGVMQQVFPREGESRPRLRFPEFRNGPRWIHGRCTDIATVKQGYGFPKRFQGRKTGKYPFYKVSDISKAVDMGQQYISEARHYIGDETLKDLRAKPVPAGTIIFAKIGEAIRSDRRVVTTKPAVIDNNTAGIKAIAGKTSDEFLFYLWSNVSLIDHAGGVVPAVTKSALEGIPITYPALPEEQKRISDCLCALDALITAQVEKLDAAWTHKRGLMQKLFSSTGDLQA